MSYEISCHMIFHVIWDSCHLTMFRFFREIQKFVGSGTTPTIILLSTAIFLWNSAGWVIKAFNRILHDSLVMKAISAYCVYPYMLKSPSQSEKSEFSECSESISIALEKVVMTSKEELTEQEKQRERLKTWRESIVSSKLAKNLFLIIIVKNLFGGVGDILVRSLPDIEPLTLTLLRSLLSLSILLPLGLIIISSFLRLSSSNQAPTPRESLLVSSSSLKPPQCSSQSLKTSWSSFFSENLLFSLPANCVTKHIYTSVYSYLENKKSNSSKKSSSWNCQSQIDFIWKTVKSLTPVKSGLLALHYEIVNLVSLSLSDLQ